MKISKQRLRQIIMEELQNVEEAYTQRPHGGLQWNSDQSPGHMTARSAKELFIQMRRERAVVLSRDESIAAATWIDRTWQEWDTYKDARIALDRWIETRGQVES